MGGGLRQRPAAQVAPSGQRRPQRPQLSIDVSNGVSQPSGLAPSQLPNPGTHDCSPQAPAAQAALALGSVHCVPSAVAGFEQRAVLGSQVPATWH